MFVKTVKSAVPETFSTVENSNPIYIICKFLFRFQFVINIFNRVFNRNLYANIGKHRLFC